MIAGRRHAMAGRATVRRAHSPPWPRRALRPESIFLAHARPAGTISGGDGRGFIRKKDAYPGVACRQCADGASAIKSSIDLSPPIAAELTGLRGENFFAGGVDQPISLSCHTCHAMIPWWVHERRDLGCGHRARATPEHASRLLRDIDRHGQTCRSHASSRVESRHISPPFARRPGDIPRGRSSKKYRMQTAVAKPIA
jgi:hypothetical protein